MQISEDEENLDDDDDITIIEQNPTQTSNKHMEAQISIDPEYTQYD